MKSERAVKIELSKQEKAVWFDDKLQEGYLMALKWVLEKKFNGFGIGFKKESEVLR